MWKFQGSTKKKWNFQAGVIKKKSCGISMGSESVFFLALEIPMGLTQFCEIFGAEASLQHILSGISKIKVMNLNIPVVFFKKHVLNEPPLFGFFQE